jgi:hypothetical protein
VSQLEIFGICADFQRPKNIFGLNKHSHSATDILIARLIGDHR